MRNTKEMLSLILEIANADDDILAVYMNGSRTNINVPVDIYQDYDIVYVVRDTAKYYSDDTLINKFGEILYMQCPPKLDISIGKFFNVHDSFNWLLQLADGNRVDLSILRLGFAREEILKDKLCVLLLDKGGYLPQIPKATDEDFWVTPFSVAEYEFCCNEFWWCMNNVTKGIKRKKVLYVQNMLSYIVRPQLIKMLCQYAGILTHFSVSMGKEAMYIGDYLPEELYKKLLACYSGCDVSDIYASADTMCKLFFDVSELVARKMNFKLNVKEANASYKFFRDVCALPDDAKEIYA